MDKVFHHGHHNKDGQQANGSQQQPPKEGEAKKLEGEFKDYMKKDEQLSAEGKEYGGLM